jgi:hypothetical protein
MQTPEEVKKRIFNIYQLHNHNLKYYECKAVNGKDLAFNEWIEK